MWRGTYSTLSGEVVCQRAPAPSMKLNASEYLVRKKCQGCGQSMDNQCKISKKSCAGIDMVLALLGESLISTFQSLAKTFQLLGRARHSVAVKVADLAEVMAQRSQTQILDAQRLNCPDVKNKKFKTKKGRRKEQVRR